MDWLDDLYQAIAIVRNLISMFFEIKNNMDDSKKKKHRSK